MFLGLVADLRIHLAKIERGRHSGLRKIGREVAMKSNIHIKREFHQRATDTEEAKEQKS